MVQGSFKISKRSSQGVSRLFQRCFNVDSRVVKKVLSVFQENSIKSFKGVSSFILQFCCSMNLIAATRAEGGLVCLQVKRMKIFEIFFFHFKPLHLGQILTD